jgi:hypothetical protein
VLFFWLGYGWDYVGLLLWVRWPFGWLAGCLGVADMPLCLAFLQ